MNGTVKKVWSAKEEAMLAELTARKAEFMQVNRQPVEEFVASSVWRLVGNDQAVTDVLIHNAEKVRDILAPFDSGVRQG